MATKEIRQAIVTNIGNLLPDRKELKNFFNIEGNSEKALQEGFAVAWGEGSSTTSCTRTVGLNARLSIDLTSSIPLRIEDDAAPSVALIYDDVDKLIKNLPNGAFLGIPDVIRLVRFVSISEPELISNNTIVKIKVDFEVNYKLNINYS